MTLRNILLAGTALGAATLLAGPALAASNTQAELDALKAQIEALQRKIDDVEIQQGNRIKTLEERRAEVEVSLKNGRPVFTSASGAYTFGISGRAHIDVGGYHQNNSDETQMIAANPGTSILHDVEGTFSAPRAQQMGFDLTRLVYDALGEDTSWSRALAGGWPRCCTERARAAHT